MTLYIKIPMNNIAQLYFQTHFFLFCCLVVLSGGVYPSLTLISSRLFGLSIFDSGLNQMELALLKKLQVTHSVILENAPQLLLQIIYIIDRQSIDAAVLFALISSFFSVIVVVFTYFFSKQIDFNQLNIKLNVAFNANSLLSDTQQFLKYKGYRTALSKRIARELGVFNDKIEIYAIVPSHNGCIVYIGYALNKMIGNIDRDDNNHISDDLIKKATSISVRGDENETEETILELFNNACRKGGLLIPTAMKNVWKLDNLPKVSINGSEEDALGMQRMSIFDPNYQLSQIDWKKRYFDLKKTVYKPILEIETFSNDF